MSKLVFQAADVRRVVEHSLSAPEQRPIAYTKDKPPTPAVIFVHDQGVYLMSNGEPRDITEGEHSFVAYAEGCDPSKQEFDDWWDTSRALVGGDDFAETLPWADGIKADLDKGATHIVLTVSAKSISYKASFPRQKVRA